MPQALVIGGSLGGLFAANLLRSIGWKVRVFERVGGDLASRGAGIGTHEELRDIMQRIGITVDASIRRLYRVARHRRRICPARRFAS